MFISVHNSNLQKLVECPRIEMVSSFDNYFAINKMQVKCQTRLHSIYSPLICILKQKGHTILVVFLHNFLLSVLQPRNNLHVITDEAGYVTFEDGSVSLQYALVHNVSVVLLRDDWKKKTTIRKGQSKNF